MNLSTILKVVDNLQSIVFGDLKVMNFPLPLPLSEAGPCCNNQRRYLWTDAFGVLNYVSQAKLATDLGLPTEQYINAAKKLIHATFDGLGQPRSSKYPMKSDDSGGYMGLRIGKELSRVGNTDMGMSYDGMYWHYIDKFIFAVSRYYDMSGDEILLDKVVTLVKQVHPSFLVPGLSYRWKLNVDMTPITGDDTHLPNHDAVSAYCVFAIVNNQCHGRLSKELHDLAPIVQQYFNLPIDSVIASATDPLGLGTHLFTDQWFQGSRPDQMHNALMHIARPVIEQALLSSRYHATLNFRLYGALMAAQLTCDGALAAQAHAYAQSMSQEDHSNQEHSSINLVMLASAINPRAFARLPSEEKHMF